MLSRLVLGAHSCADWNGFACRTATIYGFSAAQVDRLVAACPVTCTDVTCGAAPEPEAPAAEPETPEAPCSGCDDPTCARAMCRR